MNVPLDSAGDVQASPIRAARLELKRRQEALAILTPEIVSQLQDRLIFVPLT